MDNEENEKKKNGNVKHNPAPIVLGHLNFFFLKLVTFMQGS